MANKQQLTLITFDDTWKLDAKTVKVGKSGIAKARAALGTNNNTLFDSTVRKAA